MRSVRTNHRQAGPEPYGQTTREHREALHWKSATDEPERRTGAGVLIESGAVENEQILGWHGLQPGEARRRFNLFERERDRSLNVASFVGSLVTHVDKLGDSALDEHRGFARRDTRDRCHLLVGWRGRRYCR